MALNTKHRTEETEIMDDFLLEGEELIVALDKIATINRLLGGNKLTLHGIKLLLKKTENLKTITIADVGCGNGDMLRMLAEYGKKQNINFKLIGIDANAFTVNYAQELSKEFKNIEYLCLDIFSKEFRDVKYDIALCTLTLHHFSNQEIENILDLLHQNASVGIVVNDLHRSKLAYRLFEGVCYVFNLNAMSKNDGLVSILRGFKKNELVHFSKKLKLNNYSINWKWAFRYQWIISKI
ncbi:2-polyprenyl-3-methyl-5-hydroxy-6-metoxy-1,4-benzoquinol methylase [Flavobacterium nitrogenifigens]|uniref:2-polyprenyl-3-methyl-5-hydroxy-6-metoxy-1, 4-benzoquinol methylase n=2 Tax=Flavobacterium TaxID=237 RepID=A0A7W7N8R1_9FLAO|nr:MULTISPECIES: methyltransferase domain-containing protein [Flavobacterium]MBB4802682.1 2-polyprenyl-3-methyl-5-hydroxy-6-metoxy-1,4-benzoquinol methylase [Flavobacterium nitrogenifigens]MBB6387640.1 2-polyprenyl-3-methyl-5-hydroxy-6-metoxy-1,4-benzoquinol methylase [Flavobacterium notoginsengisoli]